MQGAAIERVQPEHTLADNKECCSVSGGYIRISKDVLGKIRGEIRHYRSLEKMRDKLNFRDFVKKELPQLAHFAFIIKSFLENASGLIIAKNLPFINYEADIRDFLIVAFTSCIGKPTATDQVEKKIIWEVTPRKMPYTSTITENNLEAELHTDSSFISNPEKYVALFVL